MAMAVEVEVEVEVEEQSENWRLQIGQYMGEISALSFLPHPSLSSLPFLLAGTLFSFLLFPNFFP